MDYKTLSEIYAKVDKDFETNQERHRQMWLKEMEEKGIKPFESKPAPKPYCDHPDTMENSTATFFWVVAMVVGAIFKGNWVIWIVSTIIWLKFITRHDR